MGGPQCIIEVVPYHSIVEVVSKTVYYHVVRVIGAIRDGHPIHPSQISASLYQVNDPMVVGMLSVKKFSQAGLGASRFQTFSQSWVWAWEIVAVPANAAASSNERSVFVVIICVAREWDTARPSKMVL